MLRTSYLEAPEGSERGANVIAAFGGQGQDGRLIRKVWIWSDSGKWIASLGRIDAVHRPRCRLRTQPRLEFAFDRATIELGGSLPKETPPPPSFHRHVCTEGIRFSRTQSDTPNPLPPPPFGSTTEWEEGGAGLENCIQI